MKKKGLRLMCILAHPDDESLGTGGILAKYAAEGVETYLITATHGERGWQGSQGEYPGPTALGQIREAELKAAAKILGLQEVIFLDYIDGDLDKADSVEAISKIVGHLRRIQPDVVVTFDPSGVYGHPDHIAICQWTTAAVMAAADPNFAEVEGQPPHQVLKLYYRAATREELTVYEAALGNLVMHIEGQERRATGWEEWAVTTWVDTKSYWQQVWQAVACHRSQLPSYQVLEQLPADQHQFLWGRQSYYRAFSLVNGQTMTEDDLFAGVLLRE